MMKTIGLAEGKDSYLAPIDGYRLDMGRPDVCEQANKDFDSLRPLILGEE